ncbi:MAG: response regulator [Actinomycetota bacterium]|nr:response regulator [Actinomycetota bacterium]MDH5223194.1 response regulator [Actinomycetota bacterium]MDH5312766.1 response regulator [Actinomycetota bacterium]
MRRVLVIDDEADVRLLYRVNLRHAGFEVLEADDGIRGIEATLEHLPDAVVLDLMMPGANGFQVLEVLRSNPDSADVPVLVLTAASQTDDLRRCYQLGADDVITKPFMPEALTDGISRMLESSLDARVAHREAAIDETAPGSA